MIVFAHRASAILFKFIKTYSQGTYLLPANVCPIVPLTFYLAKVHFEFVDINEDTFCIDEQKCLELISSNIQKYAGIVFVRTYGYRYDAAGFFDSIRSLKESLKIIDDRCLCVPKLDIKAEKCDLILFSTGNGKPVNFGEGGIGILSSKNNLKIYNESFSVGMDINQIVKDSLHYNRKLETIPKGWLDTSDYPVDFATYKTQIENEKMKINKIKKLFNDIYFSLLPSKIVMPSPFQDWRFNILVDNKEILLQKIFENNLFASSHYKPSNVLFENRGGYPIAEKLHRRIINLFNDYCFSEQQVDLTCKVINKYLKYK